MLKKKYFYILLLVIIVSCNDKTKFDKTLWNKTVNLEYPNRKYMVNDLIKNYDLKGKSYNQILDLLEPTDLVTQFGNNLYMLYPVDIGFTPQHTLDHSESLNLTFNKDSILTDYKIENWKK